MTTNSKWFLYSVSSILCKYSVLPTFVAPRILHYEEILRSPYINRRHLKTEHLKYNLSSLGIYTNSKTICLLIQLLSLSVIGSLLNCFLIVCLNCGAYYRLWFENLAIRHIYQYNTKLYRSYVPIDIFG